MAASLIELRVAWDGAIAPQAELSAYHPYPPHLGLSAGQLAFHGDRTVLESSRGPLDRPIFQIVQRLVQETLDANGGRFPPGAGRIVLEMPPQLALGGWEMEFAGGIGPHPVSLLRRIASRPVVRPALQFPFGISLIFDRLPQSGTWADQVFDDFVQRQLPPGIVTDSQPQSAQIWHFIGDSPDMLPAVLRQAPAPRLIVLQRQAAQEIAPAILELAAEAGVLALLITSAPDRESLAFSQAFYRKIFHNQPLDRCMAVAIAESGIQRQQVMLAADPGGEFSLLLTRVPLEMALAGPAIAAPSRRREGSRTYLQAPARERAPSARQQRSRHQMMLAAETGMRQRSYEALGATMPMLNSLEFAGEQHDVFVVKNASDQLVASLAQDLSSLEEVYNSAGAVRYTSVTLRDADGGQAWSNERALVPDDDYTLDVAITPAPGEAQVRLEFDESKLAPLFDREEQVALDVVLFAPEDEFSIKERRQTIRLPRVGRSTDARFAIVPRRSGWCRLRVAVYHRNTLLQSLALQAYASREAPPADAVPTIARQLDWAASTDLLLLDEQAAPVVSIFTNDAPDGSHWIGVFAGDDQAPDSLRVGQMRKLDSQDMSERAKNLRDALQAAHGLPDSVYRYPAAAAPDDPAVVQFGIDSLIDLAVRGREVFSYLFQGMDDISPQRLKQLRGAIGRAEHGTISIARCDARWTIPWAALYDHSLDVNRRQDLNVCSPFLTQLASNEWDDSGQRVRTVHDLLASPSACRAQPDCPLNGRNADVTICPFGFWGFRNLIEEPLAQVTATRDDEIPPEMKRGTFSQSVIIPFEQAKGLRVGAGAFPFPEAVDHGQEMAALLGSGLQWETDRDKVVQLLYDQHGHHVFYFYCHGVTGSEFAIQVGPEGALHNLISQASLDLDRFHWAEAGNPQPLVVLIACESAAARPETMHGLIGFLRNAMASGVLGSEITIDTGLGRTWGYRFMSALVTGQSVGECFLQLRHDMLRRYNPLGLAFSMYAPASLHICSDPSGKGSCARYHGAAL